MTENQLAVLAVIFIFKYAMPSIIAADHQMLGKILDQYIFPFALKVVKNNACYQHLEFAGCGKNGAYADTTMLETILEQNYLGLFQKGFTAREIMESEVSIGTDSRFFVPCLNDQSKFQINAININSLNESLEKNSISDRDRKIISSLFNTNRMRDAEIMDKCIEIRPYMSNISDIWGYLMCTFTLTSVGIAIGHANVKRFSGEFLDLSIWIN